MTGIRVGMLILMLAAPQAVSAGDQPGTLPPRVTLEQVLTLLDERSPRAAAERAAVDVVAADRLTANTLPNPTLSYGGLRLVSGTSTGAVGQHQFLVEQPLLLFGQRRARRDEADLNVSAEQARVAATLAERRLDVRQAFVTLLARQEESRLLEESRTELARVAGVVRGRADAGDRSRYDVLRIDTESRSLDMEVMNAATEVEDASGRLASLLGLPGWRPYADGQLVPTAGIPTDFDALWETAALKRPALVASEQRQSAARGGLVLARRERLPVPALSGGLQLTQAVNGTSAFFGLSLPLPLFDRSRGPIAHASAEVAAETLAVAAETAEARAEIERTRDTLISRRRTLAMFESDVIQRLPALRQMAEDSYREGQGGILELLDASRSLKDLQLAHVKQLELTKAAEEDLIAAAGLDEGAPK